MILLNVIGINFEFHTLSKQIPVIIKKKKKSNSGSSIKMEKLVFVVRDTDKLE